MSSADPRSQLWRAALRDALRRGDPFAAARAAARLAALPDAAPRDRAAAVSARRTLGAALRQARVRRQAPPRAPAPLPTVVVRRPRPLRPALAAAAVLLLAVLASWPLAAPDGGPAGGASPPPSASTAVLPQSRGRVVLALAAAAAPQAAAEPTMAPLTVVAPTPGAPAPGSADSPAPAGSGGTGAGTGNPGGGSGTGGGAATPTPAPSPTAQPRPTPLPPLPRGFARLSGQVLDAQTGGGIPGACVSLGPCTAVSTRTDASGRWTLDLPVGGGRLDWGLEFAKSGYASSTLTVRSRSGYILLGVQWLRPTG